MPIHELTDQRGATLSPAKQALLAKLIRGGVAEATPRADAIRPRAGDGPAPLSGPQRRLWFLDRMEPGSAAFNIPLAVRFTGALDAVALERALVEIVRRHTALRTVFTLRDGAPVQEVRPVPERVLQVEEVADADLARRLAEESGTPFDLAAGPVFRARLFQSAPEAHVLAMTLHHIVGDGWSTGVLLRELAVLYSAFARGEPSPLAPLPIQYADFAAWQEARAAGPEVARQLAYWRERLAGAPALLELPTDRPRPAVRGSGGGVHPFRLPMPLAERLARLARAEGATLFMVLTAGLAAVLRRWSGAGDVVLGTPLAGRIREETEGLIGFFVQTLAVRVDLSGDPSFRELLGRVRAATLGAYANQEVPFDRLVEALKVPRSLAHGPLFQVMLSLQNLDTGTTAAFEGVEARALPTPIASAEDDLRLYLQEDAEGLEAGVQYRTDLFDPATVERLAAHYRTLLEGAAADPDRPCSRLPLMDAAERAAVGAASRGLTLTLPDAVTLHGLVEAQAARTPDATAVRFEGEALTYRELLDRAGRVAGWLRAHGAGMETRVAICAERSCELVVGLLGILRAGAAYVPLDPGYPPDRLAMMLEDSGAALLLTQAHLAGRLPPHALRTLRLDADRAALDAGAPVAAGGAGEPDAAAYVIYTSGSTGRPKGAVITHRAIASRLLWMQAEYGLGADDRVLQKTPVSFDVSVWELFWPLAAGATLVLARPEGHRDAAYLARFVRDEGITTMHFVPSMLPVFLDAQGAEACASLRRVVCSGEALPAELARRFYARLPHAGLHNLYGPTEAAVDVTFHPCVPGDTRASVPIGRPVANTRIHLLDPAGEPVPVGVPGELFIGGVQVGRGYLRRPGPTAERWVPDPFAAEPGARIYRTGDLARRLPGGEVDYLGRADFQVKVRGFRIEPGEIEAALAAEPGIREAVVVVREDTPGDARIVAYFVAEGDPPAPETLRAALAARLPEWMLPSAWVPLDALPLTPSGKTDRRALPAPDPVARAGEPVLPRTPAEAAIAAIWAETLGARTVGVHDDFFELGGHSLLATRVLVRICAAFGVELPLRAFFEAPTVAGLAERIGRAGPMRSVPPLERVPREEGVALSHAQQRLWVLEQIEPGTPTYNVPVALRLSGALDPAVLARTLAEILRRHEGLRTDFPQVDGAPAARIHPPLPLPLPLEALDALPAAEREPEAMRRMEALARLPFDPGEGPLLRAALYRLRDDEHLLLVCVHHIVFDGWSMGILVREIDAVYAAFAAGLPSPLPELPVQYADFAHWQRRWLDGAVLEEQLRYWLDRLGGGAPALELPTDRPRPPQPSRRGAVLPLRIAPELTVALAALSRREGATLFMTLLAAFATLLHRYTGQDDVRVGAPIAGRGHADTEGLIGFFVNTLVLRSGFAGDPTFRELVGEVRETALGAYAHQDPPFEQLVEAVQPERDLSRAPLVQAVFALQNLPSPPPAAGGLAITTVETTTRTAKFDLSLMLQEGSEGLVGALEYDAELFDDATAERMLGHYRRLLAAAAAGPDRPVRALPLLGAEERARLAAWSGSPGTHPAEATIPALFAEVAARRPESPALVEGARTMTYGELDRRAAWLAARLRAHGVGPDVLVGIAAARSAELVVGLLAILRAGGAYLPLDPEHPAERLAFMLADAGARVVLGGDALPLPDGLPLVRIPLADLPAGDAPAADGPEPGPLNLAYVNYTSGSTGTPKGVLVPHRAVVRLVRGGGFARMAPDEVFLQYAPASFDAATLEIWGALLNGARLVVAPPGQLTPAELGEVVRSAGVTTLWLTSGLFHLMVDERLDDLRGVRQLLAGGDVLSVAHVRRVRAELPGTRLVNGYGPTENTTFTCCHTVGDDVAAPVPIGRPIGGTRVHLPDARMQPVPQGVRGELYAGGDGVARGYLNRPALTAERFVPDPAGNGGRLYRTGDLARHLPDGSVEFLGRADQQVKVRGFRIEPGEVEAALLGHPAVREAAVVVREDRPGDRVLTAYVVADPPVEGEALRGFLRERLPEPMVPSVFVPLPALPLSPTGKVDRRALPAPESGVALTAPRDNLELRLAQLWEEVLGTGPVGVRDNFFARGGHSLKAVRLVDGVKRLTGRRLPLASLFRDPTVEAMAALLRGDGADLPWSPLVGLRTGGTRTPLFCVHGGFGSVFCFAELARRSDPVRPFYGLQPRGFFGGGEPLHHIEEMAALHVEAIRTVQPHGPYFLAGYCMGGMVALEMARRLEEDGEPVSLVAMLDTKGPPMNPRSRVVDLSGDAFLAWFAAMLTAPAGEAEMAERMAEVGAMEEAERWALVLERARAARFLPPEVAEPAAVPAWLRVYRANLDAALGHVPARYGGRALLLVAEEERYEDPRLGWSDEAAGGIEVRAVPGNHETMLDAPHAEALAEVLDDAIRTAERTHGAAAAGARTAAEEVACPSKS